MRKWTALGAAFTGSVLAATIFPISAVAQTGPVGTDDSQANSVHDCKITSTRYGKNGSIGGKCQGSGHFQIRILCYKTNRTDSDSEFVWGGPAGAPDSTSLAVCRGAYPWMNTDKHARFWAL